MHERVVIDDHPYIISATEFVYTSALANSVVIPGQVLLYGFTMSSTNVGAQFVQMFDAQGVPANGTVPIIFAPVSANDQVSGYYGSRGRRFTGGIVLCNSTSAGTKTIGAKDCLFDVQYARLLDDTGEV